MTHGYVLEHEAKRTVFGRRATSFLPLPLEGDL